MDKIEYPEAEKWAKVHEQARIILEFMEWYHGVVNDYIPQDNPGSDQELVYQFFGVDSKKLEQERSAMLKKVQEQANV